VVFESGQLSSSTAILTREVRWFHTGRLPPPIQQAFDPPGVSVVEYRIDLYDLASARNGVGRKHRARSTLDTKFRLDVFTGVALTPGVSGQVEDWMKISEPLVGLPGEGLADPFPVAKRLQTRRFLLPGTDSGCEVELVDVETGGTHSWSLCFETFGAPEAREQAFEFATGQFFAEIQLPPEIAFDHNSSLSYPDWINRLAFQAA